MMGPEGMGPGKLSPNLTIVLLRLAFDQTTVPQNDKTITKLNIILFFLYCKLSGGGMGPGGGHMGQGGGGPIMIGGREGPVYMGPDGPFRMGPNGPEPMHMMQGPRYKL